MFNEFKKFAMRGNVIDLAIGVIIGGAFNKIITSLVNDIIMPPIGLALGKVDFRDLYINLSGEKFASLAEAQEAGAVTINYGVFINTIVDFLIVTFTVFLLIRQINKLKKEEDKPAAPTTKDCPYCLTSIPIKATRCPACTSKVD